VGSNDEADRLRCPRLRHKYSESDETLLPHTTPGTKAWRHHTHATSTRIHQFTGDKTGMRQNMASHINKDSTPDSVFMLYFAAVITLVAEETNQYYRQYLDMLDNGPSPAPDITECEMFLFLAIIAQMGHDIRDSLKDYWTVTEQFRTPFYSKTMTCDWFLHILHYPHFSDNQNAIDNNDPNYDRLWKIRCIFDMLNDVYSKYYAPTEHLTVDKVIVLYKGKVNFRQYIPKKHKRFGIKLYQVCDMSGYTYDMDVYLGKNRTCSTADMTVTNMTVRHLTRKVEGHGHKLYMDNFFSSLDLFNYLTKRKINCCGTVRPNRKGMPWNLLPWNNRLKRGNILSRTRDDLTAMVWRGKRDVHILTNMHHPPANGNFCDEHGNATKPRNHTGLQQTYGLC
jgi:hypothetical protein